MNCIRAHRRKGYKEGLNRHLRIKKGKHKPPVESETAGTEATQQCKTGMKAKKEKELERENGYLRSSRM